MKQHIFLFFFMLFGITIPLTGQAYYGNILEKAKYFHRIKDYEKALETLDLLEKSDKDNYYFTQRLAERNTIFNDLKSQKEKLEKNEKLISSQKDSLQKAIHELNLVITLLKQAVLRETSALFKDAYNLPPLSALEKIEKAKLVIALFPYTEESNLPFSLDSAYHNLQLKTKNSIITGIKQHDYQNAKEDLTVLNYIPNFPPDSILFFQDYVEKNIFESINKYIEKQAYTQALEEIRFLSSKNTQLCLYLEIAFCFISIQKFDQANYALDKLSELSNEQTTQTISLIKETNEYPKKLYMLLEFLNLNNSCSNNILDRYRPKDFALIPNGFLTINENKASISEFLLAKNEVTFFEYDLFCAATLRMKPLDNGHGRGNLPVIDISWYDAIAYCNWRSILEGLDVCYIWKKGDSKSHSSPYISFLKDANGYRLPTEAEWQFAAGSGKGTAYSWGNEEPSNRLVGNLADETLHHFFPDLKTFPNYNDTILFTAPKSSFDPNGFMLHNMSGNVWEWCWDEYQEISNLKKRANFSDQAQRIIKGGAWSSLPSDCLLAKRMSLWPTTANFSTGFRIAKNN